MCIRDRVWSLEAPFGVIIRNVAGAATSFRLSALGVLTVAMQFDLVSFLFAHFAAVLPVRTALRHHALTRRMRALGCVGHGTSFMVRSLRPGPVEHNERYTCLLYTSDAADERSSVDLG